MTEQPSPTVAPTQVKHPWQATLRTLAAYIVATLVAGAVALPLIADALNAYLPPKVVGVITLSAGVCATLTALTTRLMALPQVNDLLTRVGLGASR